MAIPEYYQKGKQPCKEFSSGEESIFGGVQPHDCYCKEGEKYCGLSVAFCKNCSTDHHESGYENCICKKKVPK